MPHAACELPFSAGRAGPSAASIQLVPEAQGQLRPCTTMLFIPHQICLLSSSVSRCQASSHGISSKAALAGGMGTEHDISPSCPPPSTLTSSTSSSPKTLPVDTSTVCPPSFMSLNVEARPAVGDPVRRVSLPAAASRCVGPPAAQHGTHVLLSHGTAYRCSGKLATCRTTTTHR